MREHGSGRHNSWGRQPEYHHRRPDSGVAIDQRVRRGQQAAAEFPQITRPDHRLRPRSDYAAVFLDGKWFGDLSSLRNISAPQISSIHFIRGTDAVTLYGMQYGAGVIDVKTK